MKPPVAPSMVRALCFRDGKRVTMDQIAAELGRSKRHLLRAIKAGWSGWRVDVAEKFVRCCGFDFWNMQVTPEILARIRWAEDETRPVVFALRQHMEAQGLPTNRLAVAKYAARLDACVDRQKEARCGPLH